MRTVFIVDPHLDTVDILKLMPSLNGYHAFGFGTPQLAEAELHREPDCLVLNCRFAEDLPARLILRSGIPYERIVVTSTSPKMAEVAAALNHPFLLKPAELDHLAATIARMFADDALLSLPYRQS